MTTAERVQRVVAAVLHVPPGSVASKARLTDLAPLDSLSMAEIAAGLDEEFGVRVPGDDLTAVQTVGDLVGVVERAPARPR